MQTNHVHLPDVMLCRKVSGDVQFLVPITSPYTLFHARYLELKLAVKARRSALSPQANPAEDEKKRPCKARGSKHTLLPEGPEKASSPQVRREWFEVEVMQSRHKGVNIRSGIGIYTTTVVRFVTLQMH